MPSIADLVIACGFLYPFSELYEEHFGVMYPKFSAWLEEVYNYFSLYNISADFKKFTPEEPKQLHIKQNDAKQPVETA